MKSSRWVASLTATVGLAGSLFLGAPVSSAASAVQDTSQAANLAPLVRPGVPAHTPLKESGRPEARPVDSGRRNVCRSLVPDVIPRVHRADYFCGDWRLGPSKLPTRGVVGSILDGYKQLGHVTAVKFLKKWWDPAADSGQGDWRYPNDDGYAKDTQGKPIAAPLVLHAGQKVDRFGNEAGRYLSPAGSPYGSRGIPPSGLNTTDPRYPFDYHLYRVAKDVTVCAGPIAPAFEQPGFGVQYVTSSQFCPSIPRTNVADLVRNGTLVRLKH
ncbi:MULTISPECIES: TNT domain-containing protein [unclassified Streptomyces]|uniref:TNT domain-containing protein n=1 Tax=unclassified Streptomyces TaxID=2593676 RepID=UPI00365DFE99